MHLSNIELKSGYLGNTPNTINIIIAESRFEPATDTIDHAAPNKHCVIKILEIL